MKKDIHDAQEVTEEALLYAARAMGVPYRAAMSRTQNRRCAAARALAMVYATQEVGHTVEDVGEVFGKDHSTVTYHRRRHVSRRRSEPQYEAAWHEMKEALR